VVVVVVAVGGVGFEVDSGCGSCFCCGGGHDGDGVVDKQVIWHHAKKA